jgi:hypothetical protein
MKKTSLQKMNKEIGRDLAASAGVEFQCSKRRKSHRTLQKKMTLLVSLKDSSIKKSMLLLDIKLESGSSLPSVSFGLV